MAVLEGLLSRFDACAGSVAALLVGDPGSGKTRLLDELLRDCRGSRPPRWSGWRLRAGAAHPLATVRSLLQRLRDVPDAGNPSARWPSARHPPVDRWTRCGSSRRRTARWPAWGRRWSWSTTSTGPTRSPPACSTTCCGPPRGRPAGGARGREPARGRDEVVARVAQRPAGPQRFASVALGPLAEGDGSRLARRLALGLDDERAALCGAAQRAHPSGCSSS